MRVCLTQLDVPPPIPAAVATGIVAQPGGQSGATPLTARINIVTTIAPNTAVLLQIIGGNRQEVFAAGGAQLTVYPPLGTLIKGNGLNVPVTIADGDHATFTFDGNQTWFVS